MRERLIAAIKAELERQSQIIGTGRIYIYNSEGCEIGVDGRLRVDELATAILEVFLDIIKPIK